MAVTFDPFLTLLPHTGHPLPGTLNNHRVVAPSIQFSISAPAASQVLVVGDWDDWQYSLLMRKDEATGVFSCQANLKVRGPIEGIYLNQYRMDLSYTNIAFSFLIPTAG